MFQGTAATTLASAPSRFFSMILSTNQHTVAACRNSSMPSRLTAHFRAVVCLGGRRQMSELYSDHQSHDSPLEVNDQSQGNTSFLFSYKALSAHIRLGPNNFFKLSDGVKYLNSPFACLHIGIGALCQYGLHFSTRCNKS